MLIGLGYKARSGKDTVARHLRDYHRFTHTWFAQPLKAAVEQLFGLSREQTYGDLKEVPDAFWQDTPRNILQRFGTECMRKGYRDDFWVKVMQRKIYSWKPTIEDVVISDVRFPNEAQAVKDWDGQLWLIDRPGNAGAGPHASETALDGWKGWDHVIVNDGAIGQLLDEVDELMERLGR